MDFDMKECGGCETCEIACSYKHTGEFDHSLSSIEIVEKENHAGYGVRLIEGAASGRIPCDGCRDIEGEPLCVRYCPKYHELQEIISRFIEECLDQKVEAR